MTAKEVLRVLQITRPTLTKYVKENKLKVTVKGNGRYDYDADSVYKMLNKDIERKTYLYARVSTAKQKKDLENQVQLLKNFCFQNGYIIHGIYQDIASGISFDKRKQFFDMLDEILSGRVKRVIITYKDRLSRVGFELFTHLFNRYPGLGRPPGEGKGYPLQYSGLENSMDCIEIRHDCKELDMTEQLSPVLTAIFLIIFRL